MDVAQVLREARQSAGLSQRALAARAGVSSGTVAHAESGRRSLGVPTLEALLAACGRELAVRPVPASSDGAPRVDEQRLLAHLRRSLTQRLETALDAAGVAPATLRAVADRSWLPHLRLTGDLAVAVWVPDVVPRLPLLLEPVGQRAADRRANRCGCADVVVLPPDEHASRDGDVVLWLDRGTPLAVLPPAALAAEDERHRTELLTAARLLHLHQGEDAAGRRAPPHRQPDERDERRRLSRHVRYPLTAGPDVQDSRSGRVDAPVSLPQWLD
ncbi:MAG TPA: helix-turn-helix transcriptional regulator, partial [Mycobacteriales bacterium]|nr:helix-turn-helix transcriptional regulator [Mycobacteriales bacterium]